MTESAESNLVAEDDRPRTSLGTAGARNLASTTKSRPQTQGIGPRWLLRVLPWVEAKSGTYRVNRRSTHAAGTGRVSFSNIGDDVRVVPPTLTELPLLGGFDDQDTLAALADRFEQREYPAGAMIAAAGSPADELVLIAHGRVHTVGTGKFGDRSVLGTLADGDYLGGQVLIGQAGDWRFTVLAVTPCTVLVLPGAEFRRLAERADALREHLGGAAADHAAPRNKHGEAAIHLTSGHRGETALATTYVDYELSPREYQLSVAQTVLNLHTRVGDLYNEPMDQKEQQLRLTIEALRERQEHELVNNRQFGLLHNADLTQRIPTRGGPPTPDDLDELLCRRRKSRYFLAHPRTIAAFGRECTRRGLYPRTTTVEGRRVAAWRGVPLLPCDKIPITEENTTSIMVLRTGEDDHGVIGLHQTGLPDEYQPGLSVRFMGTTERAIASYLVSAYYSAAILVPDALGVLEHVQLGH